MNKIIIKLFVPKIDREYDVFIPTNKRISSVIALLVKAINELSNGSFSPSQMPMLYNKITAQSYDINITIKESDIRNGTELILI
jgi:hypothetical protein